MNISANIHIYEIITSIIFLVAVYFAFRLSKETKNEKYWLMLASGLLLFAIHHWMIVPLRFGLLTENIREIIEVSSSIVGSLLIAYSTYGLHKSMIKVKEKLR